MGTGRRLDAVEKRTLETFGPNFEPTSATSGMTTGEPLHLPGLHFC